MRYMLEYASPISSRWFSKMRYMAATGSLVNQAHLSKMRYIPRGIKLVTI